MRARLLFCAFAITSLATLVTAAAAQTATPSQPEKKTGTKALTLTGCVAPDTTNNGHFTLADFSNGETTYRLSGADLRKYLGHRVELIGAAAEPKLKIVGGLTPNPNIAAQAGAIDPTEAAMAAQSAQANGRPGNVEIPELKVKTVRAVEGGCGPER